MDTLPDELIEQILDYLRPSDIVSIQRASKRLLRLARDNNLWRAKCYEASPRAESHARPSTWTHTLFPTGESTPNAAGAATGAQTIPGVRPQEPASASDSDTKPFVSKRRREIADWDLSDPSEKIDWYSEYIGRHAPLSSRWAGPSKPNEPEVRGLATFEHDNSDKALAALEDGSICIWDLGHSTQGRRRFRKLAKSKPSLLFTDTTAASLYSRWAPHPQSKPNLSFNGAADCVSIDASLNRAYIAVDNLLNEIDLSTLQILAQNRYPWPITALSQEQTKHSQPLTVGTSWSLHIHDPRLKALRSRSQSPETTTKLDPISPSQDDITAFLPNLTKSAEVGPWTPSPKRFGPGQTAANVFEYGVTTATFTSPGTFATRRRSLFSYAPVDPGPLSVLHQDENAIFIAGRFPCILAYDRRYFPQLEYVIHSGASLSGLAKIPHPPHAASPGSGAEATLIAAGEYNGRGSLELYSLPHVRQNASFPTLVTKSPLAALPESGDAANATPTVNPAPTPSAPFSAKNRQVASPAKILSVATHGSRIVFSDADGGLRWVERDGRSLVRRWNINGFALDETRTDSVGAGVAGEQVVRKIVPLRASEDAGRGRRGDEELLVWTGERIGLVGSAGEGVDAGRGGEEGMDVEGVEADEPAGQVHRDAEQYDRQMRHALESHARELNWLRRFGMDSE